MGDSLADKLAHELEEHDRKVAAEAHYQAWLDAAAFLYKYKHDIVEGRENRSLTDIITDASVALENEAERRRVKENQT